jgi:hypothetical protein
MVIVRSVDAAILVCASADQPESAAVVGAALFPLQLSLLECGEYDVSPSHHLELSRTRAADPVAEKQMFVRHTAKPCLAPRLQRIAQRRSGEVFATMPIACIHT